MRRGAVLAGLLGVGLVTMAAGGSLARQNVAELEKVRDNLYVIKGGGGNTAAFVTTSGVVVVDTKVAGWGEAILEKIRSVTDKPVTMIINTHTHGDHVGSNAEFAPTVEIVAQENTKANMEKMDAFKGAKAQFLPGRTFTDRMTLLDGADRIDLYYFGPGHTNGDAVVVFPAARVAHSGDLFAGPQAPIIDTNNGGSGVEYPQTMAKFVSGVEGVDTVIPGHSNVTTWQAVREYSDFMRDLVAAVRAAKQAGKTADEAAATLQLPDRYKDYNMRQLKDDVAKIYAELK
jgi:cyclase